MKKAGKYLALAFHIFRFSRLGRKNGIAMKAIAVGAAGLAMLAMLSLLAPRPAKANLKVFTGAVSGDIRDGANYNDGTAPTATDFISFPAGALPNEPQLPSGGTLTIAGFSNASGRTLTLNGILTVDGSSAPATVTNNGIVGGSGELRTAGTVDVSQNGTFNSSLLILSGGTTTTSGQYVGNFSVSGNLQVRPGDNLTFRGNVMVSAGGDITGGDSNSMVFSFAPVFFNSGDVSVLTKFQNPSQQVNALGVFRNAIVATGVTVVQSGGTGVYLNLKVESGGTYNLGNNEVTLDGSFINDGTVSGTGQFKLRGNFVQNGTFTPSVEVFGNATARGTVGGGVMVQSGATLQIDTSFSAGGAISVASGGQINGGDIITTGTSTNNDGIVTSHVRFFGSTGTTQQVSGAGPFGDVTIGPAATVTQASPLQVRNLNVNSGGTYIVGGGFTLNMDNNLINQGTFNAGTGTATTLSGSLINNATFNAANMTVTFSGNANQSLSSSTPLGFLACKVNKTGGQATLSCPNCAVSDWDISSGTFDQGANSNITVQRKATVASGATWRNVGSGDLSLARTTPALPFEINGVLNFDGGGPDCDTSGDVGNTIEIKSTGTGERPNWQGSGTVFGRDCIARGQGGTRTIILFSSTNGGDNGSNFIFEDSCGATEVTLKSFTATGYDTGVLLEWQTGFETDNLGFRLSRDEAGRRAPVTPELVAGSAFTIGHDTPLRAGQSYVWWDSSIADCGLQIADCQNVSYWLEAIDLDGTSTTHGPIKVSFVGGKPPKRSRAELLSHIGRSEARIREFPSPREGPPLAAARLEPARALAAELDTNWELASKPAVKLSVRQEGWYRVGQSEIIAAGLDGAADPRRLQLYLNGTEQPIIVTGEQDGSFDPGDSIEFYGIGMDTPYTDINLYWLAAGSQPGRRISRFQGREGQPSPGGFSYTVERKDRSIYFAALRNGDAENFFGPAVASQPLDLALQVHHIAQSSRDATLEVSLQGITLVSHSVRVQLNGADVGQVLFGGQSKGVGRFSIAQSLLMEGDNVVTLSAQGVQGDASLVDSIRISYSHRYEADGDRLRLTAAAGQQVSIGGFTSPDVRMIDVTDAGAVQEVEARVELQGQGYAITATVPGGGERQLVAFAAEQIRRPAAIAANQPSEWRGRTNRADLVLITRREFFSSLEPLVSLRQSQNLRVALVDIEDVYDEFNFGQKSPQALKDFFSYVTTKKNWKKAPRYALLAGDASFDPRNYLGFGDADLVPTRLIDTQQMETASDDWFVDFDLDGLAELAIGRLPARTAAEASAMAQKIISYSQSPPAESLTLVADANQGYDFEQVNSQLRALIPARIGVQEILRGQVGSPVARDRLFEAIKQGQMIVNYNGHGSSDVWAGAILTSADAATLVGSRSLPVFIVMTCLNGYFQDPLADGLAEALVKSERGGAVAAWASSGLCPPAEQAEMNRELFRLIFGAKKKKAPTIGEAMAKAKASIASMDIRRTWILIGDPAMKLR